MTAAVTSINITTHKGRLLQGSAFELQTKDQQGNLRVVKTGPNAGQPAPKAFIAIGFPKHDPATIALRAQFDQFARQCWPSLFPVPGAPCSLPGGLHDKWIDGDGVDTTGRAWSQREGFAGHWVLRCESGFLPKVFNVGHYDALEQVQDPRALPLGYFIRVSVNMKSNSNPTKPGLYVNMSMIEITEVGPVIQRGPDAATVFGGAQGQSIVHVNAGAPPPPAPAPAQIMNAAPTYVMAAGETFTKEQYNAQGWTDDMLIQNGKMTVVHVAAPAPPPAAPVAPPPPPPAAPAPPPPAPAPAPTPGMVSTPAAQYSLDQYRAAGWSDDRLVADGLFIRQ